MFALPPAETRNVTFGEATRVWLRVAGLSFGGPAGQIAVMHRILVEEKGWIGETRFLHALNYCMLLPGPEAHELAIYIGWLLHRVRGGIVAGTLFVLPGLIALSILSWMYAAFGHIGVVQALFFGLRTAVLAVVLEAVTRIGRRALKSTALVVIGALAFVGIFFFALPFPLIIGAAALVGFVGNKIKSNRFTATSAHRAATENANAQFGGDTVFASGMPTHIRPSFIRSTKVLVIGGIVWLGPLASLGFVLGTDNVFTEIAAFNSKMAVVTFGGAYAVLAYMAQQAVQHYHWLKPGEMLVGLGFAETTPGPLISVVQFVGFMAAFRHPGALSPVFAGLLGGALAMWSTFVPPFIWIFLGGPYVEALSGNAALNAALSAVTAAVVGVILNLAVWFALHTIFVRIVEMHRYGFDVSLPVVATINWPAFALAVAAVIAMFRFRVGMLPTLAACSALGAAYYFIAGAP